jgi:DNA polymerase type B, organellar and viral
MDIETINKDGSLYPYLICAYNGKEYISTYSNDSMNAQDLVTRFINQLIESSKLKTITVYAHNLSSFDGVLILRHLLSLGEVKPVIFNGRLMSIKFSFKGKTIIFKDSYLLLPLSLRKLCRAFNVSMTKGYFPFELSDIFYVGPKPSYQLWGNIPLNEYENLPEIWNFQEEAIKYCKLDCLCLHEILVKFNELIFKEFKINIHKTLTLPSLAMKIYKSLYMPNDTIFQINGPIEKEIRHSYTGGAVDVYIPHNLELGQSSLFTSNTDKLFYYDVNSLYP